MGRGGSVTDAAPSLLEDVRRYSVCKKCEELQKKLDAMEARLDRAISGVKSSFREYALRNPKYDAVVKAPVNKLPLLINEGDFCKELVTKRLKGESIEEVSIYTQAMSDVAFDTDDYRNIGWSDGSMCLASDLYEILGSPEKSQEAYSCMYSDS